MTREEAIALRPQKKSFYVAQIVFPLALSIAITYRTWHTSMWFALSWCGLSLLIALQGLERLAWPISAAKRSQRWAVRQSAKTIFQWSLYVLMIIVLIVSLFLPMHLGAEFRIVGSGLLMFRLAASDAFGNIAPDEPEWKPKTVAEASEWRSYTPLQSGRWNQ